MLTMLFWILLGALVGSFFDDNGIQLPFDQLSLGLLSIGLYGSIYEIDTGVARRQRSLLSKVLTLGVAVKITIIAGIAYMGIQSKYALLCGAAVAAIDPLAIAALLRRGKKGLSEEGQTILRSWSSFDDPVSSVTGIYLILPLVAGTFGGMQFMGGLQEYGGVILVNMVFAGGVYALARFTKTEWSQLTLLVLVVTAAMWFRWTLGIALIALFLRPQAVQRHLPRVTHAAFSMATGILGTMLDLSWTTVLSGTLLGVAAIVGQVIVTLLLARGLRKQDVAYLAVTQYCGMTDIASAVFYETTLPGSGIATIVAVAAVTANLLYYANNRVVDWFYRAG